MAANLGSLTGNGNSSTFTWLGGSGQFTAWGTFGGTCTVKLQFSPDSGTTWIDVGDDTSFTANGAACFTIAPGHLLRMNMANADSTSDVSGEVSRFTEGKS